MEPLGKSFYNPPYESPLEDSFALTFEKYVNPKLQHQQQFEVHTICGRYIIDFAIKAPQGWIGIECDGHEFHNPHRDEWRDGMILGTEKFHTIYRLRGRDLHYRFEDCLYIMAQLDPMLFSERGLENISLPGSENVREYDGEEKDHITITYPELSDGPDPLFLVIERRYRNYPKHERRYWDQVYKFARKEGGGNLDALMARYDQEMEAQSNG